MMDLDSIHRLDALLAPFREMHYGPEEDARRPYAESIAHPLWHIWLQYGSPVQGIRLYRWVKDGLYTAI